MEHPLFRARWGTGLAKINHSNVSLSNVSNVHRDHQQKKGKARQGKKTRQATTQTTLFLIWLTFILEMIEKRSEHRLNKNYSYLQNILYWLKIGLLLVFSMNFLSTKKKNNVLAICISLSKSCKRFLSFIFCLTDLELLPPDCSSCKVLQCSRISEYYHSMSLYFSKPYKKEKILSNFFSSQQAE